MDAPSRLVEHEDATEEAEASPRWVCAACETDVASPDDAVALPGHEPVHAQVNPYGIVFLVRTFSAADVAVSGPLVPAFTWYPGFAWRAATCRGCREHLGWVYLRIVGEGLGGFVGLIDSRLALR